MTNRDAALFALRVRALRDEMTDPYTASLGAAAVRCVADALNELIDGFTALPAASRTRVLRACRLFGVVLQLRY